MILIVVGGCRQSEDPPSVSPEPENETSAHSSLVEGVSGTLLFECMEDKQFALAIGENGDTAELQREGARVDLERVASSTGARFGNGQLEVWLANSEGAFIVEDSVMTYQDCVRVENE